MGRTSLHLVIVGLAALLATPAGAQRAQLENYPRVDLDSIAERHREWLEEEVVHIITDTEYDVFLRLDSEEKRDIFMEQFWKVRDPTPGTPRNEYYELHYERLAYATEYYGRGTSTPGWRTDRGRIHILLGEPISKTRVSSDMVIHPMEVWFYSADPDIGVPSFFYMAFYQRNGSGDYRIYSPLSDGPERLLNGAGQREVQVRSTDERYTRQLQFGYAPTGFGDNSAVIMSILQEIDSDVANAAFSLFPSEAGAEFGVTPLRSEILLGQVEAIPEFIMRDATWAYNVLTGVSESEVRFETLEMQAVAHAFVDEDGEPFIHFAAATGGEHLSLSSFEDRYYFAFDAAGSVTTFDHKVLQNFEWTMSRELEEAEARRFTRSPFIYMDVLTTLPGTQKLTLMLENEVAHTFGRVEIDLTALRGRPDDVTLVGPMLAIAMQEVEYDPFGPRFPYQFRDMALVPSVDSRFERGQPIYAFQQILLPEGFAVPLTGRIELFDAAGSVAGTVTAPLEPSDADANGVITHLWTIDTDGMNVGEYSVRVSIDGTVVESDMLRLRVVEPSGDAISPFINAQPAPPPVDVSVAMERAEQYRKIGDLDSALDWLRQALARDPDNDEVRAAHVELLQAANLHQELIDILTPLVVADPRDVDSSLLLARAHAEIGQHYDAIRYYERARIIRQQDSTELLNALADEYFLEGQAEKTVELLGRSLELDPDQPEIRAMLARISEPTASPRQ